MRVLVVRIGAMGDVLHALPAVEALRRELPDCYVGWAVEPRWMPLLRKGLVDRVHAVPAQAWKRRHLSLETAREIATLRRELRGEAYDVCVDLQGSIRSATVGLLARAARFVGPARPRERPAAWFYDDRVAETEPHVIDQACRLLGRASGRELAPLPILLPEHPELAGEWERGLCWPDSKARTVLVPTAGWGAKQWPAEYFRELALRLRDYGQEVLVNAVTADDQTALRVAENGAAQIFECDLAGLTELLRRTSLVIGGDTGPVHLAAALGAPVVALFGPTDPVRTGPQGFPGSRVRVLRSDFSRTSHKRHTACEEGLGRITVEAVYEAAMEMLRAGS